MQSDIEQRFKAATDQLQELINKRKNSWKLTSVMAFEDVSSIILAHIWQQFAKYDPSQPLDRWANTVITRRLHNLLRDNLYKNAKPCTAANPYGACCSFNRGNGKCGYTKSGEQDSTCRFFANWLKKKQIKHAISTPVSLDDEGTSSDPAPSLYGKLTSPPGNFIDMEAAKKVIDIKIMNKLNKEEATVYRLLFIKHLEPEQVGEKMGYKKQTNSDIPGYLKLKKLSAKFRELAGRIVAEEGLV